MTPEQKIKWAAIVINAGWDKKPVPAVDADNVDDLYDELVEVDAHWDAIAEIRGGDYPTGLTCDSSRHYESESVAKEMPDGSWVGWTLWSGGGKHGEPESVDWMDLAYDLDVTEEEKVVIVREFSKG